MSYLVTFNLELVLFWVIGILSFAVVVLVLFNLNKFRLMYREARKRLRELQERSKIPFNRRSRG